MTRRTSLAIVAVLAALAVAWWWHGRSSSHGPSRASSSSGGAGSGTDKLAGGSSRGRVGPARLEGRITGVGGAPIPDAVVLASPRDGDPLTVGARADGTFTFDALPSGVYVVIAAAPGFLPERKAGVAVRRGETSRVELALTPGGVVVRGTVTDALSGPVAGAAVAASQRSGFFFAADEPRGAALTDAAGRYTLTLPAGTYRVAAHHPEYVEADSPLTLGTVEVVLDFVLVPGGAVEGVVRELATGAPLPGATVIVEREAAAGWDEQRAWGRGAVSALAGDDGHFRVAGIEPGTLTVRAELAFTGQSSDEPVIVSLGIAEQVDGLELWVSAAAPYIAGRVIDERGAPVPDATVVAQRGRGYTDSVDADAEGEFRLRGIAPGEWQLTATGEHGQATAPVKVTLADVPVTDVVVKVAPAPSVVGRIEPAAAASITITKPRMSMADILGHGMAHDTTAGDDGRFELTPMAAGPTTLEATTAGGRGTAEITVAATGVTEVVIHVDAAGTIAGHVVDEHGAPVPGAVVIIALADDGHHRGFAVNGVDQSAQRAPATADGSFTKGGLVAGRYELTVVGERGGLLRWAGAGQARAPTIIELGDREQKLDVELAVEVNGGVIRGVVRSAGGAPRPEAWVVASLRPEEVDAVLGSGPFTGGISQDGSGVGGTPPVLTDAAGRFEVRGLRRGVYDVTAEADRGTVRGRTERVATGSETTVTLAGLGTIAGTVTGAGGGPITDFSVEVIKGKGRRQQRFHDAAGKFRFPRIDPGRYKVRAISPTGSADADVTVASDQTAPIAIEIAGELATAHGQIVDGAGKPRAGLTVSANATGATRAVTAEDKTDDQGRFELDVAAGTYELIVDGAASGKTFAVTDGQSLILDPIARP